MRHEHSRVIHMTKRTPPRTIFSSSSSPGDLQLNVTIRLTSWSNRLWCVHDADRFRYPAPIARADTGTRRCKAWTCCPSRDLVAPARINHRSHRSQL